MHYRRSFPLALIWTLVVGLGAADTKLNYLAPDSVNVLQLLPDPPARGSQEEQAELQVVLRAQESRTTADVARTVSEDKFTVFAFADVLGSWFTPENCPHAARLFTLLDSDVKHFTKPGKERWNRVRPPFVSDLVKPVGALEQEGSYPSGHSTRATLFAEILSEVLPRDRQTLLARAQQIGWDRVIAGVHYPSDVYAGRTLGQALARAALGSSEFHADLEQVKSELSRAAAGGNTAGAADNSAQHANAVVGASH